MRREILENQWFTKHCSASFLANDGKSAWRHHAYLAPVVSPE